MAFSSAEGSFTSNTSTGNQSVSGLGFQPKAVMFWLSDVIVLTLDVRISFGLATSSTARWAMSTVIHDQGVGNQENANRNFTSTKCISHMKETATILWAADFVSMDSDGFTINWSTVQALGVTIFWAALGGSDLSAIAGTFDSGTGTGNQAVTGTGFQPNIVLFGNTIGNTTEGTAVTSVFMLGVGVSSSSRNVTCGASSDGQKFTGNVKQVSTLCISRISAAAENTAADFVSNDSNGFTVNFTTNTAARRYGYLALAGTNVATGVFTQPGSTGNSAVTGTGFTPSIELFFSDVHAHSTALITTFFGMMIGASVSTSQRGVSSTIDDVSQGPGRDEDTSKCIQYLTGTAHLAPTLVADADFVSHDSNGFTLNWAHADATAREAIYIALGQVSAGSTPMTPYYYQEQIARCA